jgi:septum formation protein
MKLSFASKNAPPPEPPKPDVILASQSMGRKTLLEKLSLRFRVVVARINEESIVDKKPEMMIKKRATAKALEVVQHPRVYTLPEGREALIVAADSMAILNGKTYGKPADRDGAREMLKALMGKTHAFVTAVHMVHIGTDGKVKKTYEKMVTTKVTLRKMSTVELESYVLRYDLSRFAASHAINDAPWDLVTKIDGSYTNVIGLPFEVLLPVLRQLKIII